MISRKYYCRYCV